MKFDKFMEHCFRIMCICVACVVFLGAVFSCAGATITARAVSLSASEKAGIQDYFNAYSNGMLNLNIDFSTDEDGNRSRKIEIYALQQRALQDQFQIYDDMSLDFSTTQNMGGAGSSGLYRSSLDNKVHVITLASLFSATLSQNFTSRMIYSDEFDISYTFRSVDSSLGAMSLNSSYFIVNGPARSVHVTHTPHERYQFYKIASDSFGNVSFSNNGQVTCTLSSSNSYSHNTGFSISSSTSSIPSFNFSVSLSSNNTVFQIGSCGTSYTLPDADIQTTSPWDYYNDSLLPYIRQNYDIDNIDQYLVFPDGYNPGPTYITNNNNSVVVGPVIIGDPSIINLGGVDFDVFAPIKGQLSIDGIDFNFPLDQNDNRVFIDGQPYELPSSEITIGDHTIFVDDRDTIYFDGFEFHFNADGTITINNTDYTLPVGTPSVLPSDVSNYEMYYEIPTMENINIVDSDISPVDISAFGDGISMFWGLIARFYADTGLFGAMTTCLGIAAIGYAIAKLGGH